tara:strand:+ start:1366 stop:1539 length:174 start_codon:yes stop_codon:yes gene_type:complete
MYLTELDSKKMDEILARKDKKPPKKKQSEIFDATPKRNYNRKRKMRMIKKKKVKQAY